MTYSKRVAAESGLTGIALMLTGLALSLARTPAALAAAIAAAAAGLGLFAFALVSALAVTPRAPRPPSDRLPDELNAF